MTMKSQIYLASAIVLGLVMLFVIFESRGAQQAKVANEEIQQHIVPGIRHLEQLRFGVIRIVSSTSELIVASLGEQPNADVDSPSVASMEVDLIHQGEGAFRSALAALALLHHDHHNHSIPPYELDGIVSAFEGLVRHTGRIITLVESHATPPDLVAAKEAFEEQEVHTLATVEHTLEQAQATADDRFHGMAESIVQLRNDILVLGFVVVAVLLAYSVFVTRLLQREASARALAEQLAHENRLEVEHRKRIEARLASHQKLEALGTMLGGIAHSVNNFLTPIITLSQLLKQDAPPTSELRQDLDHILHSAQNASTMLKDVLAFSRTRTTRLPDSCDLVACLRRSLAVAKSAMSASVTLKEHIDLAEAWVPIGEADIETIILNLTGNAVDALRQAVGHIAIALGAAQIADGMVAGTPVRLDDGAYVRLSVTDTGTGIPPENLLNIFDPFFTTKEVGKGSGLGLSITYASVAQAGGDIIVSSEPGAGTRFDIFLPRLERPNAAIAV